jgi:hypothetical protein
VLDLRESAGSRKFIFTVTIIHQETFNENCEGDKRTFKEETICQSNLEPGESLMHDQATSIFQDPKSLAKPRKPALIPAVVNPPLKSTSSVSTPIPTPKLAPCPLPACPPYLLAAFRVVCLARSSPTEAGLSQQLPNRRSKVTRLSSQELINIQRR